MQTGLGLLAQAAEEIKPRAPPDEHIGYDLLDGAVILRLFPGQEEMFLQNKFPDRLGLAGILVNAPGTKLNIRIYTDYVTVSIETSDPDLALFSGKYLRQ